VRVIEHVFGEAAGGKVRALVTAEVDVRGLAFEAEGDRFLDTLEWLLVLTHRETGEILRHDRKLELRLPPDVRSSLERSWLRVDREAELAPGVYQAKVVVRDKRSGVLGSVTHDFEVPDPRAFRTSSPVLADALEPAKEGVPPRPVIPARRTFLPDSTLYFQFEVYGAGRDPAGVPRVVSGYSLRTSEGSVVAEGAPALIRPGAEGHLGRLGIVRLQGVVPGRYDLVLGVRDEVTGRALEVHEPFSIDSPPGALTVVAPAN